MIISVKRVFRRFYFVREDVIHIREAVPRGRMRAAFIRKLRSPGGSTPQCGLVRLSGGRCAG